MKNVYNSDGSYYIDAGDGFMFGPYGPGQCPAVYVDGKQCAHMTGHVGCHSADVDPTTDKYKHRWNT